MTSAIVIGCGNIGKRHAESLAQVAQLDTLVLVDPRPDALRETRTAVTRVGLHVVDYPTLESAASHHPSVDLVVSAVTADQQPLVASRVRGVETRWVILEKPVAQSRAMMDAVTAAFVDWDPSRVRVNCVRPLFSGWQRVKSRLQQTPQTQMHCQVYGRGWGFGCNAVHFLDLFRYLTNARGLDCTASLLDPVPEPHRRGARFAEFHGSATFRNNRGDSLSLRCDEGTLDELTVVIREKGTGDLVAEIDELADRVLIGDQGWPLGALPVSRSTGEIFKLWLADQAPALATLEEARVAHEALFGALARATGRQHFPVT